MKNVVLSMLAKISHIDASMKQLTARVKAQSLLISALALDVSREGGVTGVIESASKIINTVIDSAESEKLLKSDAVILLSELQALLKLPAALDSTDDEINHEALDELNNVMVPQER